MEEENVSSFDLLFFGKITYEKLVAASIASIIPQYFII